MLNELPSVTFKIRTANEFENDDICFMDGQNPWTDVTSEEMFENKRVLIFSLPGAFTPTCTAVQVGVNAPGSEKINTRLFSNISSDVTSVHGFWPSIKQMSSFSNSFAVLILKVTEGNSFNIINLQKFLLGYLVVKINLGLIIMRELDSPKLATMLLLPTYSIH